MIDLEKLAKEKAESLLDLIQNETEGQGISKSHERNALDAFKQEFLTALQTVAAEKDAEMTVLRVALDNATKEDVVYGTATSMPDPKDTRIAELEDRRNKESHYVEQLIKNLYGGRDRGMTYREVLLRTDAELLGAAERRIAELKDERDRLLGAVAVKEADDGKD